MTHMYLCPKSEAEDAVRGLKSEAIDASARQTLPGMLLTVRTDRDDVDLLVTKYAPNAKPVNRAT